jgi:hypothetical protein
MMIHLPSDDLFFSRKRRLRIALRSAVPPVYSNNSSLAVLTAHVAQKILNAVFDCSSFSPTLELCQSSRDKPKCEGKAE